VAITDNPLTTLDGQPTPAPTGTDSAPGHEVAIEALGQLMAVDPATLIIGANVRREVALDKPFLRSIADRGVREPIIARRRDDGALVVRKGKRRTLAAVEAGRPVVPVLVEPGTPEDDTETDAPAAARIDRILDQLEVNHHRTGTSDADEVRAHQQLLDLGLSAGQIARRTLSRPAGWRLPPRWRAASWPPPCSIATT
jgi:ParB family chromosome partitioning protein